MRVMTMEGGFRGLAQLPRQRVEGARARFLDRIAGFDIQLDRLIEVGELGQFPEAERERLLARSDALTDRIQAHMLDLDFVTDPSGFAAWERASSPLVRDTNAWVADVRRVLGDERTGRGLRLFLVATASIALIGGVTYTVWRASGTRGRRRSRRR